LVRFAERLTTLLNRILALQALAQKWRSHENNGAASFSSPGTGQKKPKWT